MVRRLDSIVSPLHGRPVAVELLRRQVRVERPYFLVVEKLNELDVSGVEPTAHATPLSNVMREDEPRDSLSQEDALRNAPKTANGLFVVPKIVE